MAPSILQLYTTPGGILDTCTLNRLCGTAKVHTKQKSLCVKNVCLFLTCVCTSEQKVPICKYFLAGGSEEFSLQDTYCNIYLFSRKKSLDGHQEVLGPIIPFPISNP